MLATGSTVMQRDDWFVFHSLEKHYAMSTVRRAPMTAAAPRSDPTRAPPSSLRKGHDRTWDCGLPRIPPGGGLTKRP